MFSAVIKGTSWHKCTMERKLVVSFWHCGLQSGVRCTHSLQNCKVRVQKICTDGPCQLSSLWMQTRVDHEPHNWNVHVNKIWRQIAWYWQWHALLAGNHSNYSTWKLKAVAVALRIEVLILLVLTISVLYVFTRACQFLGMSVLTLALCAGLSWLLVSF